MDLVQSSRSRRTLRAADLVDYFEAALHMKSDDGLVKVCQTLKNLDAKRGNVTSSNLAMAPKKTKVKQLYALFANGCCLYALPATSLKQNSPSVYVGGQLPARRPGLAFEQIVGCPRLPNQFETSC